VNTLRYIGSHRQRPVPGAAARRCRNCEINNVQSVSVGCSSPVSNMLAQLSLRLGG